MWDFETEPEFQKKLDWVDEFVREEVEPIDVLWEGMEFTPPDDTLRAIIDPLKQRVRDQGLWACHLGPELGGQEGQAGVSRGWSPGVDWSPGAGGRLAGRDGRRWFSQRGRYQVRSPRRASEAGTRMPRTIVASMRTADAVPMPRILRSISGRVAKVENRATMIRAALVTTPALLAMPPVVACRVVAPRARSSRMRLRMKTW